MGASDSLRQKKIKFFCPILDTSTCASPYVLFKDGEKRDESKEFTVYHGTFRNGSDYGYLYAYGI